MMLALFSAGFFLHIKIQKQEKWLQACLLFSYDTCRKWELTSISLCCASGTLLGSYSYPPSLSHASHPRFLFWFDLLFMFPWAAVILSANPALFGFQTNTTTDMMAATSMGSMSPMQPPMAPATPAMALPAESSTALYISLLSLLKLVSG
jgi:hypothetical protein